MSRRIVHASAATLAAALSALGCSDATSPSRRDVPAAVHVVAADPMLADGDTARLTAVIVGRLGDTLTNAPVTWSSTDAGAVTVGDTSGLMTAVAQGSAWITAASGDARDSVQVMVNYRRFSGPKPFASVTLFNQTFTRDDGCALTRAGAAYCWGVGNRFGQLGTGGTDASPTPVAVTGGHTFAELHAGNSAACGLTASDGQLYCWGRNLHGQFGTGSQLPDKSLEPMAGAGAFRFRSMSLGVDGTTCAVSATDGVVYCWGNDTYYTTGKDVPDLRINDVVVAPVTGSLVATQVHVFDYHGCAVAADGAIWCWGNGTTFGLDGSFKAPVRVTEPGAFASVVVGSWATCGLTAAGQAMCWGYPPVAPGTSTASPVTTPTAVGGALRFRKLSIGYGDFACGLTLDGDVYCWGSGTDGVLGRRGSAPASAPVQVLRGRKFVDVDQSCAVDAAGDVYCWY